MQTCMSHNKCIQSFGKKYETKKKHLIDLRVDRRILLKVWKCLSFVSQRRIEGCNFTNVSEVLQRSIIRAIVLTMEAVQTSETSAHSYQSTRRYNPEDRHLRALRRGVKIDF
jgi:hypothetical protein